MNNGKSTGWSLRGVKVELGFLVDNGGIWVEEL